MSNTSKMTKPELEALVERLQFERGQIEETIKNVVASYADDWCEEGREDLQRQFKDKFGIDLGLRADRWVKVMFKWERDHHPSSIDFHEKLLTGDGVYADFRAACETVGLVYDRDNGSPDIVEVDSDGDEI